MRRADIQSLVRELFDSIGELAVTATLRRPVEGDYTPGTGASRTYSEVAVRVIRINQPLRESQDAKAAVIDAPLRYALVESTALAPRPDDELAINGESVTLLQVVPMDAGAGALYEVTWR